MLWLALIMILHFESEGKIQKARTKALKSKFDNVTVCNRLLNRNS